MLEHSSKGQSWCRWVHVCDVFIHIIFMCAHMHECVVIDTCVVCMHMCTDVHVHVLKNEPCLW
jgi:thiosulfate reductase cytochrome b subunit